MVTINLDGFSLANRRRFAKFAKHSPRQTFPLYGTAAQKSSKMHSCVSLKFISYVGMKRQVSCGQCSGCLSADCGKCVNCLDKRKFGGPNKRKQRCIERHCRNLIVN